jgi:hypothetical protein
VTLAGYYAVVPETDALVYCKRIDFNKDRNPVGTVLSFMRAAATQQEMLDAALAAQPAFQE